MLDRFFRLVTKTVEEALFIERGLVPETPLMGGQSDYETDTYSRVVTWPIGKDTQLTVEITVGPRP